MLQQSFVNFSSTAPRFSQLMDEMQSSLDESDPAHQLVRRKVCPATVLGEEIKHEHRDSGISGEGWEVRVCVCVCVCVCTCVRAGAYICVGELRAYGMHQKEPNTN